MFLLCSGIFAQSPLTLDDIVERSKSYNKQLAISRYQLEKAVNTRDNVWSYIYPKVSGSFNYNWQRLDNTDAPAAPGFSAANSDPVTSQALAFTGSASLGISSALYAGIRTQYLAYEIEEIAFEATAEEIEKQVRKFYFDILLLKESLELFQKRYEQAQELLSSTQASFDNGFVSEIELLQVRLRADGLKLAIERQESLYNQQLQDYLTLVGFERGFEVDMVERIADYSVNEDILNTVASSRSVSIYQRSDVRITEQRMKVNASTRTTSILQLLPLINVSYSYTGVTNGIEDAFNFDDSYYTDNQTFSVGLQWTLSELFPLSTPLTSIINSGITDDELEESLVSQIETAENTIDNLIREIERELKTLEEQSSTIELNQQLYDRTLEAYNDGTRTYDMLRQTEIDLLIQEQNFLSTQVTLIKKAFDLAHEANILFTDAYVKTN